MRIRSFFLVMSLVLFSCKNETSKPALSIAASANMQFAISEITEAFTARTNVPCELIVASSGKLTAQIVEGAPFDVFLSADLKYPNELYQKDYTNAPPKVYAYGKLVLWTLDKDVQPSLLSLKTDQVKHIAMAHPKTAPYGKAALEVLNHHSLYDSVRDKLIYGESISQINQFVNTQAAQFGFTSKSVVLAPNLKGKGQWLELDADSYTPIAQGIVLVNQKTQENPDAKQFYDFIFSEEARNILKKYGYSVDE